MMMRARDPIRFFSRRCPNAIFLCFLCVRPTAAYVANLWNKLPSKVRYAPSLGVFKSKLKTHLFQKHFCAN